MIVAVVDINSYVSFFIDKMGFHFLLMENNMNGIKSFVR